jgi:GT2 family glycosyltransferase
MTETPIASIVIPTRDRPEYLGVALQSIVPQAKEAGAEVIVVSDGPDPPTAAVAERHGARLVTLPEQLGINPARNAGVEAARAELIVFTDADVETPAGWLAALLGGARANPDLEVFGGAIRARLEGGGPRACGREPAPITTLDAGARDRDVPRVWGANMAIRRSAFERIGLFDDALSGRGDEEEWELRYIRAGGRIRYLAAAGLDHRRTARDARLRVLVRAAYQQGRESRQHDIRTGQERTLRSELRILAGCAWHTLRRRCAFGIVMGARAAGSLRGGLTDRRVGDPETTDDFVSGTSGLVFGIRATGRAVVKDAVADAEAIARGWPWQLRRAAAATPRRRVLALGIERSDEPNLLAGAWRELSRSKHEVRFDSTVAGDRGKFENLNALLARNPVEAYDWLLAVDDDVVLPGGFLDTFLFLAERFELRLAQPAHRARSHAAWAVTRRRAGSIVRETAYVEIGPVTAFSATTFDTLLPFPPLKIGWGLDAHWGAVAKQHGWRIGIVDATPISHGFRKVAASYDRQAAIEEARRFLSDRPYVKASEAQRTLVTHRTWR